MIQCLHMDHILSNDILSFSFLSSLSSVISRACPTHIYDSLDVCASSSLHLLILLCLNKDSFNPLQISTLINFTDTSKFLFSHIIKFHMMEICFRVLDYVRIEKVRFSCQIWRERCFLLSSYYQSNRSFN